MSTTLPDDLERRVRSGARRVGYVIAASANLVLLWVAHHLLEWGWPGFLTDDFEELLPIISISLLAGVVTDVVYIWDDRAVIKAAGDLITTVIGLIASIWTWRVFPFDVSDGWVWVIRTVVGVGIIGTTMGALNALWRLAGRATHSPRAP